MAEASILLLRFAKPCWHQSVVAHSLTRYCAVADHGAEQLPAFAGGNCQDEANIQGWSIPWFVTPRVRMLPER